MNFGVQVAATCTVQTDRQSTCSKRLLMLALYIWMHISAVNQLEPQAQSGANCRRQRRRWRQCWSLVPRGGAKRGTAIVNWCTRA